MKGFHWRLNVKKAPRYINVPFAPHRILVIGLGRLSRRSTFHKWQPCCYPMTLHHCCPGASA